MFRIKVLTSVALFCFGAVALAKAALPTNFSWAQDKEFDIHYNEMRELVTKSIELRERAVALYHDFKVAIDSNVGISKDELERMYVYHQLLISTRNDLNRIYYNDSKYLLNFSASEYENAKSEAAYKRALMAMAAKTLNDDNYIHAVVDLMNNDRMREVLNKANKTLGIPRYSLYDSEELFLDKKAFKAKHNGFLIVHKFHSFWLKHGVTDSNRLRNLYDVIVNATAIKNWRQVYPDNYPKRLTKLTGIGIDFIDAIWEGTIFGVAKGFGFTVGTFQWKDGKLTDNAQVAAQMKEVLQPLDILLERTRNRVSGKFIPGFWVHGAVWLGTKEQLEDLGIWNAPEIVRLHSQIEKGASIIEALRYGVVLNTVEHFLNVDDLVIARPLQYQNKDVIRDRILATARLYGKKYDFGFNGESNNTIYCTEVVAEALHNTDFPMTYQMGTWYHSPDGVAQVVEDPLFFDVLLLYINGREITTDKIEVMQDARKNQ